MAQAAPSKPFGSEWVSAPELVWEEHVVYLLPARNPHQPCHQRIEIDPSISCTHRTNGHHTKPYCRKPSSTARDRVPSACYRKGKRGEDIDLTTGLWNNGEPHYLPGWQGGTSSKLLFYRSCLTADRLHLTRHWTLVVIAYLSSVSSKHETSEASTASTMRLCFPITGVIFFTILRE